MICYYLLVLGLLLFLSSFDSFYLSYGNDKALPARYAAIGVVDDFNGLMKTRYETGYWSDRLNRSSFYATTQIGLDAANEVIYSDFYTGVSLISQPDLVLSTPLEFKHDLGVGVVGKNKVRVGFNYSHLSNAGIRQPNFGRDSIQFKLTLPIK